MKFWCRLIILLLTRQWLPGEGVDAQVMFFSERCDNITDAKVCVGATGFFYTLGNGTWNFSSKNDNELEVSLRNSYSCPIAISVDSDPCTNNCCYCGLEFPLPHHSISNDLLMPVGITCESHLRQKRRHENWHHSEADILRCKSDTGNHHLSFLCLLIDNLKRMDRAYNVNLNAMNKDSYYEKIRSRRTSLSWRNTSFEAARLVGRNQLDRNNVLTLMENENDGNTSTVGVKSEEIDAILYRIYSEQDIGTGKSVDFVTILSNPIKNITFNFSAPTECLSKYRRWDTYPPCSYIINADNFSNCYDLKTAIRITGKVIARYTSGIDVDTLEQTSWDDLLINDGNDTETEYEKPFECEMVPSHVRATQVWADGQHVVTVLTFDSLIYVSIENEFIIMASTGQKVVTEKDFSNLSKFWVKFYYGDCLYRHCWRDVWSVFPRDLIQNANALFGRANSYFGWRYFLPIVLAVLILIVRSCIINREYEVEIE